MCISAATGLMMALTAAGSVAGAVATQSAAKGQANQVQYQSDMQNKQLEEEKAMMRLKAQQQEAVRLNELSQMRSRNIAAVAGSGVDENISYLEGIDPYNERQAAGDLGTLNLNRAYQTNRIADQIHVNRAQSQFAKDKAQLESQAGWIKAGSSIVADASSRYRSRNYYAIGE